MPIDGLLIVDWGRLEKSSRPFCLAEKNEERTAILWDSLDAIKAISLRLYMYRPNPFTTQLDYVGTPKAELRQFYARFVDALPERTAILADLVRGNDAFGTWAADLTPQSLEPLGAWFVANVRTRPKTEAELAWTQARSFGPVSPVTLTDNTYSLAADVGMYFARVMMRRFPQLRWHLPLGGRTVLEYGQPVLKGFRNRLVLPPVHIATVRAWKIADGEQDPIALRRIFDVWSTHADPSPDGPALD